MNTIRADDNLHPLIAKLLDNNTHPTNVLPSVSILEGARKNLYRTIPKEGIGLTRTIEHLTNDVKPALNANSLSPNYYGFVTGGSTPAASLADNLVTLCDQNVQVHVPNETVATDLEDAALRMLCSLLLLEVESWPHRTFTTGATASNVIGLACGRESIVSKRIKARNPRSQSSIGELGVVRAMKLAGLEDIQILTSVPHSSLSKAASLLGLGRSAVKFVNRDDRPHELDLEKLEAVLKQPNIASIVAISCSEVNTGNFATHGGDHMKKIRSLCDQYGAWIHVDGAFGIFARLLDETVEPEVVGGSQGVELADSITGDCHKLLNVPYDCGFIVTRDRDIAEQAFLNPNAAYLGAGGSSDIASPLNIGIENSRRFRALPVYSTLVAYGREGYRDMLQRQVALARGIARFLAEDSDFELLPSREAKTNDTFGDIFIIVLFRAKNDSLNQQLVKLIKQTSRVYVSGTAWEGKPACRFAVSNWQAQVERDLQLVTEVLRGVASSCHKQTS